MKKSRKFEGRFFNSFSISSPKIDNGLGTEIEGEIIRQGFSPSGPGTIENRLTYIDVFGFMVGGEITNEEIGEYIFEIKKIDEFNSKNKLFKRVAIANCEADIEFHYLLNKLLREKIDHSKITIFKSKNDFLSSFRREYLPYYKLLQEIEFKLEISEDNQANLKNDNSSIEIEKLKTLIRKNDIEIALDMIAELSKEDEAFEKEIILVSNKFYKLKSEMIQDLISRENANLEHNRLIMGFLYLIEEVKKRHQA